MSGCATPSISDLAREAANIIIEQARLIAEASSQSALNPLITDSNEGTPDA